jgi:all-trans-retinol 13,14-reductase
MSTKAPGPHDNRIDAAARNSGGVAPKLGYVAWIVYGLLARGDRWPSAGLAGVALMVVVVATEYRRRAIKVMDCTSLAYFAAETLIVLISGTAFIQRYHLALVWGVFAAVAWLTIIVGSPFTLQYTREQMPREIWGDPAFYQMNRRMTEVWAVIFTLGMVLGEFAMRYGHRLILGVIVPMAAMGAGVVFSRLYPRRYAAGFSRAGRPAPSVPSRYDQPAGRIPLT